MIVCEPASDRDEPGIRALLREAAMGGRIRLTMEREPDSRLAATIEGERHHQVVVRDGDGGQLVGVANRAVRRVWLGGRPELVGYLGQLRMAAGVRVRRHVLVRGFELCEATRQNDEMPFDFTSIMADNVAARRLLERGLPGLPTYTRIAELVTLMVPTGRRQLGDPSAVRSAGPDELGQVAALLRNQLQSFDLAPVWTEAELGCGERCRGLKADDFLVLYEQGRLTGCVAIWNQQPFKQVVIRGYALLLGVTRPLLNLALALARRPTLPRVGSPVRLAHLSHLAVEGDRPETAVRLVRAARRRAAQRGISLLALGLNRANPLLHSIRRRFPARELGSILYLVHRGGAPELDGRLVQPEVAIL